MSMYVLIHTSLRCLMAAASSAGASNGTGSSKLLGDQKRFQIEDGRGCESWGIALEVTGWSEFGPSP